MIKRTVIIGDKQIIDDFRSLCKRHGRIVSNVVVGFMLSHIQQCESAENKVKKKKVKKSGR